MRFLAALALIACGSHEPAPAEPAPPSRLARFDALGKLLADEVQKLDGVAQTGDCKQLAAALRGFAAQHRPQMDELNDLAHGLTPEERMSRSDEIEDYGHRWDNLTGHAKACSAEADVKAALELAGF